MGSLASVEASHARTVVALDARDDAPEIVAPVWPDPLADAAYHGLAGEAVRAIAPHTEADPAALLVQFLAAAGNVAGRGPHWTAEADRHGLNLFVGLVGMTAKGRKGTSWGHIRRLFCAAAEEWAGRRVWSGLSSGEGLIHAVRDPILEHQPVKEHGRVVEYQDVVVDPGEDDKRLFVLEGEMASTLRVLARDGNTLSALLRNAWDSGTLRTMTKSPLVATSAHVSIVGHVTKDELLRYLGDVEAANGFANRFLWCVVRRANILPDGGSMVAVDMAPVVQRLCKVLEFVRMSSDLELRRDEAARLVWHEVYPDLSEGKPGLLGAVTARAEAQVMRLACIYAVLDESTAVTRKHLEAALAVWDYAEASARFIFGDALGDPDADLLLAAIRKAQDGLTRTDISALFGRNKSAGSIARILGMLAERGLVVMDHRAPEGGDGRSAVARASRRYERDERNEITPPFFRLFRFFRLARRCWP